jgi:hypothetical protein
VSAPDYLCTGNIQQGLVSWLLDWSDLLPGRSVDRPPTTNCSAFVIGERGKVDAILSSCSDDADVVRDGKRVCGRTLNYCNLAEFVGKHVVIASYRIGYLLHESDAFQSIRSAGE